MTQIVNDDTGATRGSNPLSKVLTNNTVTSILSLPIAAGSVIAVALSYFIEVRDGTNVQVEEGSVVAHVTNTNAGAQANNTVVKYGNQQAVTSGTLTVTWTVTAASPAVLKVNANSSLTPSTNYPALRFWVTDLSQQGYTAL